MKRFALLLITLMVLTGCAAPAVMTSSTPPLSPIHLPSPTPLATKEPLNMAWVENELLNINLLVESQSSYYGVIFIRFKGGDYSNTIMNIRAQLTQARLFAALGLGSIKEVEAIVRAVRASCRQLVINLLDDVRHLPSFEYMDLFTSFIGDLENVVKRLDFILARIDDYKTTVTY